MCAHVVRDRFGSRCNRWAKSSFAPTHTVCRWLIIGFVLQSVCPREFYPGGACAVGGAAGGPVTVGTGPLGEPPSAADVRHPDLTCKSATLWLKPYGLAIVTTREICLMQERLVDILNDKNNVLHVFPVPIEADDAPLKEVDLERRALEAAAAAEIVPNQEEKKLKARLHVSRGGPLRPYGDSLQTKTEQKMRLEERIRERAYFLWQEAGCPEHQADGFWQHACEIQCASTD